MLLTEHAREECLYRPTQTSIAIVTFCDHFKKRFYHNGIGRATLVLNWNDRFSISVLRLKYRIRNEITFYSVVWLWWEGGMWRGVRGGGITSTTPFPCIRDWDELVLITFLYTTLRFWLDTLTIIVAYLFIAFTLLCLGNFSVILTH